MDHDIYREWLDLEADAALEPESRAELARHVAGCAECGAEQRRLARLHERLAAVRVAVDPGFSARVMSALGQAAWEGSPAATWRWPFVALLGIGALAAGFSATADAGTAADGWGAVAAVGDLLVAALAAGSGLVAASWSGVAAAVAEWLAASPANWLAALGLAAGLDFAAYRLLRGRARRAAAPATRRR